MHQNLIKPSRYKTKKNKFGPNLIWKGLRKKTVGVKHNEKSFF